MRNVAAAALLAVACSALALAAWSAADRPAVAAAQPSPAAPPGGRLPIRRLTLDQMKFADRALGDKVRRLHAAAEKMARPGWDRKPYETFPDPRADGVAYAHWCTFVGQDRQPPINYNGPRELNTVQLGAFFDPSPADPDAHTNIHGVFLYARWKPARSGWSAYLTYGKTRRTRDVFTCAFYHHAGPNEKPGGLPRIELFLDGHANYTDIFRFGESGRQTEYQFSVTTWEGPRRVVLDDEVGRILKSPESLRDFLVAPYRKLLKRLNEEIPEEKGYKATTYPGRDPSGRRLSDAERQQVLKAACDDVGLRIRTVEGHYRELFAAQRKAFPLRECLVP